MWKTTRICVLLVGLLATTQCSHTEKSNESLPASDKQKSLKQEPTHEKR
jgi:hypothetical protein